MWPAVRLTHKGMLELEMDGEDWYDRDEIGGRYWSQSLRVKEWSSGFDDECLCWSAVFDQLWEREGIDVVEVQVLEWQWLI